MSQPVTMTPVDLPKDNMIRTLSRRWAVARGLVLCACVAFGLIAAGCDDATTSSASGTAPAANSAPAPAPAIVAGVIQGSATTVDGKPLASFGGDVGGYSLTSGQSVRATLDGVNGRYTSHVGAGQFALRAWTDVEYNGRKYRIDLHPADDKPALHKYDTSAGLVKDFVWKLDGYRPGQDERSLTPLATYGGTIDLNPEGHGVAYWHNIKREGQHAPEPRIAPDATVELTLTPNGPLIDGSTGKPLVLTLKPADIHASTDRKRRGIPIGRYTATARALAPDGSARPLRITAYTDAADRAKTIPASAASVTLEFPHSAPPSPIVNRTDEVTVHVMY